MSIAWAFPGQGSQKSEMADAVISLEGAIERFDLASEILGVPAVGAETPCPRWVLSEFHVMCFQLFNMQLRSRQARRRQGRRRLVSVHSGSLP